MTSLSPRDEEEETRGDWGTGKMNARFFDKERLEESLWMWVEYG